MVNVAFRRMAAAANSSESDEAETAAGDPPKKESEARNCGQVDAEVNSNVIANAETHARARTAYQEYCSTAPIES